MSETCGLSMTTSVTFSVLDIMRGIISTPTFRDFAVRNGAELNLGSSAIARLSAPREPLKSDRLRLATSTLRPGAAEACCSIAGRKWLTGMRNGAMTTNKIKTTITIPIIFSVRLMGTSERGGNRESESVEVQIIAHSFERRCTQET